MIVIEGGITIERGITIGDGVQGVVEFVTENNLLLISEDGQQFIEE